ncbi:hypothetical protein KGF54_005068 [Candida jiufengensis]|uniref:uncharacterized protein n=1 Tax=Candida jiufengensis TaxID=497108 RepID=UPI0022259D38|nr:uncharacterized protein KGF54_005068 [Candida jiufengensis]KAI5951993.1 hypothetical protein KGF54_005068 [Candida jiufengensis]
MSVVTLSSNLLLNISDILARGIKIEYGVLLGYKDGENFNIVTSFELNIDHLYTRFNQLQLVYPQCLILGIYHIIDNELTSSTIAKLQQLNELCQTYELPISQSQIYIIYTKNNNNETPFQVYSANSNDHPKIKIASSETENIVASTIDKHKNYNSAKIEQKINTGNHLQEINQLIKTSNSNSNSQLTSAQLQAIDKAKFLNLQTIQLSLLTEQRALLDKINHQFVKQWRLS